MHNPVAHAGGEFNRLAQKLAIPIIIVSIGLILFATLYPFRLQPSRVSSIGKIAAGLAHAVDRSSGRADRVSNILLFMPLSFGLAAAFRKKLRTHWWLIVIGCAAFSVAIELTQLMIPRRVTTLMDVLTNSAGGVFGLLAYLALGTLFATRLRLAVAASLTTIATLALAIPLQTLGRLSNWDETFVLTLGNDRTGVEPWAGTMRSIYLAEWAVPNAQLAALTAEGADRTSTDWLLAADFTHPASQPNLVDREGRPRQAGANGLTLNEASWAELPAESPEIVRALRQSNQFTLVVDVLPNSTEQTWGRIISLSGDDADNLNVMVAQDGTDLIAQLRTPATGSYGVPVLRAPGVFASTMPIHIALKYERGTLQLATNGQLRPETLRITPGMALFSRLLPVRATTALSRFVSVPTIYDLAYDVFVFGPFGLALALLTLPLQRARRSTLIVAGAFAMAALFEIVLMRAGGQFVLFSVLINALLAILAAGVVLMLLRAKPLAALQPLASSSGD